MPLGPWRHRWEGVAKPQLRSLASWGALQETGSPDDPVTTLHRGEISSFRGVNQSSWTYTLALLPREDSVLLAGLDFFAEIQLTPNLAGQLWTFHQEGPRFESVIANYLRVFSAYALLLNGGLLVHGAAFEHREGEAALLFGPSGIGKSTLSRKVFDAGGRVLSDDLNLLWQEGKQYFIQKVPLAGEVDRHRIDERKRRLTSLLRLTQGATTRIRPLSAAESFASLLASSPFVNGDSHRSARLEERLHQLLSALPANRLEVSLKDPASQVLSLLKNYRHPDNDTL